MHPAVGSPDCASARCSMDAGCRCELDGSWICICTHDFSLPREDGSCPRFVVAQYPRASDGWLHKKLKVITFGTANDSELINWLGNSTGEYGIVPTNISSTDGTTGLLISWFLAIMGIILVTVTLVTAIIFLWQQKKRTRSTPASLFRHLLNKNRFVLNVDYEGDEQHDNSLGENTSHHSCKNDGLILLREWIQLEEEIGQGCFGQVYRGRYRRPGESFSDPPLCDETVAVKILKSATVSAEREFFHEAQTMAEFSHPNILAVRGVVVNEGKLGSWLVFEYMSLGDLAQLLRTSTVGAGGQPIDRDPGLLPRHHSSILFKEAELMSVAGQIASGMAYLSSQRYVHRDLACRNCLVNQLHKDSTPKGSVGIFLVKISDFGMSRDVYTTDYYRMGGNQSMLPVRWMSPESILYGKFSKESDVWSYGVVLWEIFSMGAQPYYGHSNEEAVELILKGTRLVPPESTPLFIRQLLYAGCWSSKPNNRPSFKQIDDKIQSEQRRIRHSFRNQISICNYSSDTEINSVVLELKETAVSGQLPIKATSSISTVVSLDYLELIPDPPNAECCSAANHQTSESIV